MLAKVLLALAIILLILINFSVIKKVFVKKNL